MTTYQQIQLRRYVVFSTPTLSDVRPKYLIIHPFLNHLSFVRAHDFHTPSLKEFYAAVIQHTYILRQEYAFGAQVLCHSIIISIHSHSFRESNQIVSKWSEVSRIHFGSEMGSLEFVRIDMKWFSFIWWVSQSFVDETSNYFDLLLFLAFVYFLLYFSEKTLTFC